MSYQLNQKIKDLVPYTPISGEYKIRLDANESTYNLSDDTMNKINQAIKSIEFNRYPDPYAVKLCSAFAKLYNISDELVTAGNGSDELIGIIIGAFLSANDNMLTFSKDFSMYKFYGDIYGVNTHEIQKNEDLIINIDFTIEYINQNSISAVIFSNPCNPTSLGMTRDDVIKLVSSVDCLVVLDEAYMDFYDQSLLGVVEDFDNLIILRTSSKAIGLAGLRLGFAVANKTITKAIKAAKSPYNVNTVSQIIGEIVLNNSEYINNLNLKIVKNRDKLINELIMLSQKYDWCSKIYNSKTNFVFIKTQYASQIYNELLNRSIAIRNMGEYLRISTGNENENKELLFELEDIIKSKFGL